MDSFRQPHRFMRPQPPSMADPHFNHHHAPPPPPPPTPQPQRQPAPPQAPWYSGQFQYQSPSPPPPQWAPQQSQSEHLPPPPPYPAPLHTSLPPYAAHLPPNQLPPHPHAPLPPPPPPHSQVPQPYSQVNQEWGNSNWGHHQGWEYPAHNNEEDWGTRARAWAAAKSAIDNQHSQSPFTPIGRQDEHSQYHDQYPQAVEPHYPDFQQQSLTVSSYQQYPVAPEPPQRPAIAYLQEPAAIGSGSSSYVPDGRLPYAVSDGTMAGESSAVFPHQETLSTSSSVHLQEVPSSYSSVAVAGKEATPDQNEQLYKPVPFPISADQHGQHHAQPSLPSVGRSIWMEQPHFAYGSQSTGPTVNLADQPLDFVPRFNHEHDPHLHSGYTHPTSLDTVRGTDPVASLPSINNWTPSVMPGPTYPSAGPQHDTSMVLPPPVSGHSAPLIGRIAGQSLQPSVPSISATFGLHAGAALHPTTGFSTDAYGISAVPERPKKASVPNWLKEEIIKKKSVITSSAPEQSEEETPAFEDDVVDKSVVKGHQADNRSLESSRSTEEEDDDEDYDEAARTTAINQEIKRVLTEVLLKVTDELFDEIATKVVNESDLTDEADPSTDAQNHYVSPPAPALKASAGVIIPVKTREPDAEDINEKASAQSAGNILGLANYTSDDDDDDDEIPISRMKNSRENSVHQQSAVKSLSDTNAGQNGSVQAEIEDRDRTHTNGESDPSRAGPLGAKSNSGDAKVDELSDNGVRESEYCNVGPSYSLKGSSEVGKHEISADGRKVLDGSIAKEPIVDNSQGKEVKIRPDKSERREIAGFARKDIVKQLDSVKVDEKGDANHRRQDGRHLRKEKADERNVSKQRFEGQGFKHDETAKEPDSRKRSSHLDAKDDRKETEGVKKSCDKEESYRKRERTKDEKGDRSRHKPVNDSSRHKRRRSSSPGNRGRNTKDNSVVSHAHDSSDDASDDSKRKLHSRRRNISPLPSRSKRRQVSRSPHSKRSQRRHSPYSSLETTRGRRSRSKSPAHRRK